MRKSIHYFMAQYITSSPQNCFLWRAQLEKYTPAIKPEIYSAGYAYLWADIKYVEASRA